MQIGSGLHASTPRRMKNMDMEMAKLAFQIGQFALTAGVGFYVYMSNKDKVTNDRISKMEDALDSRLDDHATRIARLEEAARHAPTHNDLAKIYTELNATRQSVDMVKGEVAGIRTNTTLITEHLLKN